MHAHHLVISRFYHYPHANRTLSLPPPPSSSLHRLALPPTRRPTLSSATQQLLTEVAESTQEEDDGAFQGGGPIELPPSSPSSSYTGNTTPLQVTACVFLTGATAVFLYRSLRRRAKRAKELRLRSSDVKDTKKEALENLKLLNNASLDPKSPPSPVQAFLGALAAGAVAFILYKFTITVEASLNRQAISDNYSVRQLTITIRTVVNGLCYLATCVFGVNSIGLLLYSLQLAFNSVVDPSTPDQNGNDSQLNKTVSTGVSTGDTEAGSSNGTQNNGGES